MLSLSDCFCHAKYHFPVGVLPSVHYARLVLAWDPVFSSSYSGWDSSQQDSRLYFNPFVGAGGKDWMMCAPGTVLFPLTTPLYLRCLHNLRSCTLSNWFCHWTLPPPHVADNDNAETCASCERDGWQKDSLLFPLVCRYLSWLHNLQHLRLVLSRNPASCCTWWFGWKRAPVVEETAGSDIRLKKNIACLIIYP